MRQMRQESEAQVKTLSKTVKNCTGWYSLCRSGRLSPMTKGSAEAISKAEALKRAKEQNSLEKTSKAVQHVIESRTNESMTLSQADLPELPTIHIKRCHGCSFIIPQGTRIVKVGAETS